MQHPRVYLVLLAPGGPIHELAASDEKRGGEGHGPYSWETEMVFIRHRLRPCGDFLVSPKIMPCLTAILCFKTPASKLSGREIP